jgi:hypothetical protein
MGSKSKSKKAKKFKKIKTESEFKNLISPNQLIQHGSRSIYSFEDATDYVYDSRWAPTHPAVFATADGSGYLDVWDANEDTEVLFLVLTTIFRAHSNFFYGFFGV